MQFVHGGQVFSGLSVTFKSRLFKLKFLWHFVPFLFVDHLGNHRGAVYGKKLVCQSALFITNCGDDILGFLGHLIQKQIDHTETPLSDVDSLLWTQIIGNVGEMTTDQRTCNNKSDLSWKF